MTVTITHEIATNNHLYNWLRSQDERVAIYQGLRALGIRPNHAQRVRDWSDYHIEIYIENHLKSTAIYGEPSNIAVRNQAIS